MSRKKQGLFQDIANIIEEWANQDINLDTAPQVTARARYEGGIFLLAKRISSRNYAEANAFGIKSQIEKLLLNADEDPCVSISVMVFTNSSVPDSDNAQIFLKSLLEKGIEIFTSDNGNESNVYVEIIEEE